MECRHQEMEAMRKNYKLFDELMSGIDAMRQQREGKIALRSRKAGELTCTAFAPESIRVTPPEVGAQVEKAKGKT